MKLFEEVEQRVNKFKGSISTKVHTKFKRMKRRAARRELNSNFDIGEELDKKVKKMVLTSRLPH